MSGARQPERSRLVRFGVFEADLDSRELRKHGVRIRVQEQPFKILGLLLERPGEVVSREDLVHLLWPDGTFVEYDKGLNAAVNRLRQVLADSAENPRYLETVARRGYRWIAPVEPIAPVERIPEPRVESTKTQHAQVVPTNQPWLWVGVMAAVAIVSVATLRWMSLSHADPPATALQPAPLTSYDGAEHYATFSPDGTQIAFSWNGLGQDNYDIYVRAVGSGSPQRLTTDSGVDSCPSWSPDGRFIAFHRAGQGIHLISPTGGAERMLLSADIIVSPTSVCPVSWSPDGQHLAFARAATPNEPAGIFLMALEGGTARRLTPLQPDTIQAGPAFSPDGKSLAFVSASPTPDTICIVTLDEGLRPRGPARVLARRSGNGIVGIDWTNDGQAIVFGQSTYGVASRLWKVGIRSGSQPELLTFAGPGSIYPAVARTGFRLAYSQSFFDRDFWSFQDGVLVRSPLSSTRIDRNPQFSPDGKKVVFASDRSGKAEIWAANSDGSEPVQLTFSRASGTPRWSPDRRWIVYDTQDDDGRWDVNMLDPAGGTPIPVIRHPADDDSPSFSGDGKWIYFASNRSGRYEIYRIPSTGGEPMRLTDNGGRIAFESADRKSIYYSKMNFECGGPLFVRSLDGGPERQVIASACARGFAVLESGIYFIAGYREGIGSSFWRILMGGTARMLSVRLFDPGTGQTRNVVEGKADRPLHEPLHLAVSRDGRAILLSSASHTGTDLYLAENFR